MKLYFNFILAFFLLASFSINKAETYRKFGSLNISSKKIPSQPYGYTGYSIGRYVEGGVTSINRTLVDFNTNDLPDRFRITNIQLIVNISDYDENQDFEATITLAEARNDLDEVWEEVGSAEVLQTFSYDTPIVNNPDLLNLLEADIRSVYPLVLGIFSSNGESSNNSYANVTIELVLDYEVPIGIISVMNNMDDYLGGNIGVNNISPSPTSPYSFYAFEDDNINLLAIENQTNANNGFIYTWNALDETESPANKSEWRRKKNNILDPSFSNSQSTTYEVTSNDDEANIIGYLRKVCNLTFTNSFNGISSTGTIKVNGSTVSAPTAQYQVIDQNTIQVEALPL